MPLRLLLTCLLTAAAWAQGAPGAWARLAVPQGVGPNAVDGQGKLLTHRAGATLDVYSSVTRSWRRTTVAAAAPMRLFNDCLVVLESTRCVAFASFGDDFVELPVSTNATILNGSSNNDSIALVADGAQLHAFSAFTATWTSRPISPTYAASTLRHVAVVYDGAQLAAISAFDGVWRETIANGPIGQVSVDGTAAVASDGATLYGFSAHGDGWREHPAIANAAFLRGDDYGLWHGGGSVVAFSGLRDAFADRAANVLGPLGTTDLYALLQTGAGALAYSAVTGDFADGPAAPTAIDVGDAAAILTDAQGTHGYSPLRQTFTLLPLQPLAVQVAGCVGAVDAAATGDVHCWSSLTARWHRAPTDALGGDVQLTTTAIGFSTATAACAFGPQRGAFTRLPAPVLGLRGNENSARLLAYDQTSLHAFDVRTSTWRSRPRTGGGVPAFRSWRTTSIVLDGDVAHGIGAQAGRWHALELGAAAASASLGANSEVGYVVVGDGVLACGMLPELVPTAQFPHFRRVQPIGADADFRMVLPRRLLGVAAFGTLAQPVDVPGLGTLWLRDLLAVAPPTSGLLRWPVPSDPALRGAVLAGQAVLLMPDGSPRLGDLATVVAF